MRVIKTISLEYGEMTYVDAGSGPAVLVAHGMSGGYDQGYETLRGKEEQYRILAPSRFGYLGSSVPWDTSPKAQAAAYAQFLDKLGIERTYILGTSAGGTVAIRFALDYPERTLGLILYSSAMPFTEKPATVKNTKALPLFCATILPCGCFVRCLSQ
ncbi:alpha/beta fold hydrolase [Paenibacillus lentus]|uniref:alpha/beta fold hydrolase n=1 Tax=Paenibacillus lentus TaxID=1338368 RepID=UPI0036541C07